VFAELEYNQSMTCCWNSTTPAMYEIVMDYTLDQGSADTCADPVVFKARGGNYHLFADYAEQTGRGHLWEPWSEDESCPQAPTTEDVEATTQWTDWCDLVDEGTSEPEDGCGGVTWEGYCDGDTVVWCANESIVTYECPSSTECGWLDAYDYYWCL